MSLTTLSEWLRCPICVSPLSPIPPLVLGCESGHRFDANKAGFVTLLTSRPRIAGDTAAMLDARTTLLNSGAYDPVAQVIADDVLPFAPSRLIDIGSGTGHYSAAILERLPSPARVLATDIASDAVRRSVRRIGRDEADGLVADTWRPLPIRNGIADVVIDVFAPRNAVEFRRILDPEGCLVVATPHEDHLIELRRAAPMLGVPANKSQGVKDELAEYFTLDQLTPVRYQIAASHEIAVALRSMGPSGHHDLEPAPEALPSRITVAIDVLRFRPRASTQDHGTVAPV